MSLGTSKDLWEGGKASEVEFWSGLVSTRGGRWPEEFAARLDPATPLDDWIVRYLDPDQAEVAILDVGAGPMTSLGKAWAGHAVRVTAVDALADDYDRILRQSGITPPVRTERCDTERLLERFPRDHFDLSHARNTLDHSYDPIEAIRQMIAVTKPGGHVLTSHFANEAEGGDYTGLHQWNFCVDDDDLIIWNKQSRHSLRAEFRGLAEVVELSDPGSEWVVAVLKKAVEAA